MPKTVKKQSKLSNVVAKLKPNTGKKKLLMFVLIFALIGGGYMTYKSFAATGFGIYGVDQFEAVGSGGGKLSTSNGSPTKGNTYVWHLSRGETVHIKNSLTPVIWARNVRACANVAAYKTSTNPTRAKVTLYIGGHAHGAVTSMVQGTSYRKVCSLYVRHTNANWSINANVQNTATNGVGLTVGSISLEYY